MKAILDQFNADAESVYALIDFDKFIIELPLRDLGILEAHCEANKLDRALQITKKIIKFLSGIHDHGSTKLSYQTIYNQCVVLLVSYFTASLEDFFEYCVSSAIKKEKPTWLEEKITLEVGEFTHIEDDPTRRIGEFLINTTAKFFLTIGNRSQQSFSM